MVYRISVDLLFTALLACAGAEPLPAPDFHGLPFLADDYARAGRGEAFLDAWADGCHTCHFMKSHGLVRGEFQPHANRFVWLEVARFPGGCIEAVETFRDIARRFIP